MPDFYDSEDDDESSPKESSSDKNEGKEDEQQTALVPKSIFAGHKCKVGDIKKFRVVHEYQDEVELEYVGKDDSKDKSDDKSDDDSEDMKDSMDELDKSYA